MKRKGLIIFWICWFILIALGIITIVFMTIDKKANDEVVESYESGLDEIAIDFDDDKLEYDVCIGNTDKGTLKHYFVKLEDVVVIPYTENEAYIEITKSGKCKLYFFIKWEVEE